MNKVLCFGSLNIDYTYQVDHFVNKGETLASSSMTTQAGGKGLNQSIALAKAGLEVYHAGAIGEDGRFLLDTLSENGVNTDFVSILPDISTGHAMIQNDKTGDNCILLFSGANYCVSKEVMEDVFAHFEEGDYLVIQNEINDIQELIKQARRRKMKIVLNPSPLNRQVMDASIDLVDYLILNEIEAEQILQFYELGCASVARESTDMEYIAETLASGLLAMLPCVKIVLTLGEYGALYKSDEACIRQKAYKVSPIDTTAAGDTFTGFFIAGLIRGKSISEAMDLASRASAVSVTRRGAADSIPDYEDNEIQEL